MDVKTTSCAYWALFKTIKLATCEGNLEKKWLYGKTVLNFGFEPFPWRLLHNMTKRFIILMCNI